MIRTSMKKENITELEKSLIENHIYGVIYKITNIVNGKSYVGRKKLKDVKDLHDYYGSGIHLKNAVKKYGIEQFKKEYVDIADNDQELDLKEIFYIFLFDTMKNGYNMSKGGEHFRGIFSNNEQRKKLISEKMKQYWKDHYEEACLAHTGWTHSEETKKKMSNTAKSLWTLERKKEASESGNYKRVITDEQKQSMSEQMKNRIFIRKGDEQLYVKKEQLEDFLKEGYVLGKKEISEETRKKMSEKAKKRKKNNTKGRKAMNKDDVMIFVEECDIEKYKADGWVLGTNKSLCEKRKTFIPHNKGKKKLEQNGKIIYV